MGVICALTAAAAAAEDPPLDRYVITPRPLLPPRAVLLLCPAAARQPRQPAPRRKRAQSGVDKRPCVDIKF